jgi:hypothetical protein
MKDTTEKKEKKESRYSIPVARMKSIYLFPASESTEVSDAVDTFYHRIENTAVET